MLGSTAYSKHRPFRHLFLNPQDKFDDQGTWRPFPTLWGRTEAVGVAIAKGWQGLYRITALYDFYRVSKGFGIGVVGFTCDMGLIRRKACGISGV